MRQWIYGLLIAAAALAAGHYFIALPIGDMVARERFANEAHAYLEKADPKIVRAAMDWAEREDALEEYDRKHLRERVDSFRAAPFTKWYRGGGDWTVMHYEIRQAMLCHARRLAEKDGLCPNRMDDGELRAYLPDDWCRWEQLFTAHFMISRNWNRSRPLAHLRSEYRELREKLEEFMAECGIE